jgi:DNA replication protein DnaC
MGMIMSFRNHLAHAIAIFFVSFGLIRKACSLSPQDPKKRVLFLHIGKAGGGTITDIIKFNNLDQHVEIWHPQGELRKRLFIWYDHILINIRDPVERAISAINYECLTTEYRLKGTSLGCCQRQNITKQMEACATKASIVEEFKGSSNIIGESLLSEDASIKLKAELLMDTFIHTRMNLTQHVGGTLVLQQLLEHNVKLHITVLGEDFIPQVLYQLGQIMSSIATNDEERKAALSLKVPKMHSLHKSFSNYNTTSPGAEIAFTRRYADDYKSIAFLGEVGCGKSLSCLKGVHKIVKEGIRWGHLDVHKLRQQQLLIRNITRLDESTYAHIHQ